MKNLFKRICATILVFVMATLTACGSEPLKDEKESSVIVKYDNTTMEGIIEGAEKDFATTIEYLNAELDEIYQAMDGSYDGYIENKQSLYDWYDSVKKESSALFERTEKKAIEYYKLIVSTIDPSKEGTMSDAMEDFYTNVFENGYHKYYEEVCDDMLDFVYGEIYEEIVEEAEGSVTDEEWEKEDEECYERLECVQEEISDMCYDVVNLQKEIWYAVGDAFGEKDFDVEAIVEKCKAEYEKEKQEDLQESDAEEPSDEFVEMMDAYEEFFDEYVGFINEYNSSENVTAMLEEYTEIMTKYTTVMQELDELETTEMSTADALYYSEVMLRISEKMLEIEY